jgi:hypothetical protein
MEISREVFMECAALSRKDFGPCPDGVCRAFVTDLLCFIESVDADLADEIGAALGACIWQPSPPSVPDLLCFTESASA